MPDSLPVKYRKLGPTILEAVSRSLQHFLVWAAKHYVPAMLTETFVEGDS